jgi:polyglycine hydrolase-like protein
MRVRLIVFPLLVACVAVALGGARALAQTCRWAGTAPYCAGECSSGETEETRAQTNDPRVQGLPSENHFGNTCTFGTKAYCCKTPGITCRWDGTAPFCDGECAPGENAVKECSSCSGKACATGTKVKCCRATTGSSGSPLETAREQPSYAAIWEKGPGPATIARHGMTSAQYQAEVDALVKKGFRPVYVSGYGINGKDYYAAIWEERSSPAWVARHRMTSDEYQQEFKKFATQGYRLVHVSGYDVGSTPYYAAIWEKGSGPAWVARHGMTSAEYQQEFNTRLGQGYRLVEVSGYAIGGKERFAAIWTKGAGPAWTARHGMTSDQYQTAFNDLGKKGYRLVHVSGYGVGGIDYYAAIWEKKSGPAWMARHRMTADAYQEEFDFLTKDGYRLRRVSGFPSY